MTASAAPLLSVRDLRSYLATGQGVVRAVSEAAIIENVGILGGDLYCLR